MKKELNLVLATALVTTGVLSSFPTIGKAKNQEETPPQEPSAEEILLDYEDSLKITDLDYEVEEDNKIIYTYTENGKSYRAVEIFNEDFSEVDSEIYLLNESSGEYTLVEDFEVTVDTDEEEVTTVDHITDEVIVDGFDFEEVVKEDVSEELSDTDDDNMFSIAAASEGDNIRWDYSETKLSTNKPNKWTVGVIGITIAAFTKIPASVKWVTNVANLTYQLGRDVIYYKKQVYIGKNKKTGKTVQRLRYINRVYADSGRTRELGVSTTIMKRQNGTSKPGIHHWF